MARVESCFRPFAVYQQSLVTNQKKVEKVEVGV